MLIMAVRYLCNRNGKRKTDSNIIVFEDNHEKITEEMQLSKLRGMGIDAIEILKSKPKADVIGVSLEDLNIEGV